MENLKLFKTEKLEEVCPICNIKKQHLDWWTCKECSKKLNVKEYIEEMKKYFK